MLFSKGCQTWYYAGSLVNNLVVIVGLIQCIQWVSVSNALCHRSSIEIYTIFYEARFQRVDLTCVLTFQRYEDTSCQLIRKKNKSTVVYNVNCQGLQHFLLAKVWKSKWYNARYGVHCPTRIQKGHPSLFLRLRVYIILLVFNLTFPAKSVLIGLGYCVVQTTVVLW